MIHEGFVERCDRYIKANWPKAVPEDCTRLDEKQLDCLERGSTDLCTSCNTFERLYKAYVKEIGGR